MERSGTTKVAISPSFVEPGTLLAVAGERRSDIYRTATRTLWEATERGGDETTRESMRYDASARKEQKQ